MSEGYIESFETLDSRQFLIAVRKLADSLTYGTDNSPFLGSGVEYVQSRPYQAGDSVRIIDWRVTARTGRYYVKEYEPPKGMPCYLLIDTSASMTISSARRSKYETALFIAGGLAFACLDRVSPVGVIGVGERAIRLRPSLSRNRVLQWIYELRRFRYDERTSISARLREIAPSLTNRALMIVLSDLHEKEAVSSLRRLAQAHDCVVLQLQDPAESSLGGAGFFRAREAETGREFVTRGRDRSIDQALVETQLRLSGVDHLLIRTDRPFAPALRHLFQSRGWIMRGGR